MANSRSLESCGDVGRRHEAATRPWEETAVGSDAGKTLNHQPLDIQPRGARPSHLEPWAPTAGVSGALTQLPRVMAIVSLPPSKSRTLCSLPCGQPWLTHNVRELWERWSWLSKAHPQTPNQRVTLHGSLQTGYPCSILTKPAKGVPGEDSAGTTQLHWELGFQGLCLSSV